MGHRPCLVGLSIDEVSVFVSDETGRYRVTAFDCQVTKVVSVKELINSSQTVTRERLTVLSKEQEIFTCPMKSLATFHEG